MADLSDGYFENIFNKLLRGNLASRRVRHKLVDHFKQTIQSVSSAGYITEKAGCRVVVGAIIRYHQKKVHGNGRICLLGNYHNVLYLAVKLCFDYRLTDAVVSQLLKEIYECEKSFERILTGAIFGVTVTHFIAAWKSDFKDQRENISAVAYFLEEAAKTNLQFKVNTESGEEMRKLADVPISVWNETPIKAALQMLNPEIVLLLLRFDASFPFRFVEIYPADEEISEKELECVNLLLRAVPSIYVIDRKHSRYEDVSNLGMNFTDPPRLKHLCRCKIRKVLSINSKLPLGIKNLGLPEPVCDYLDLLID